MMTTQPPLPEVDWSEVQGRYAVAYTRPKGRNENNVGGPEVIRLPYSVQKNVVIEMHSTHATLEEAQAALLALVQGWDL